MSMGLVFNIQKYSLHDGPGIRTTVFLKGCPLECSWCHNPEGISPQGEMVVMENRCIECGECRRACPQAHGVADGRALPAEIEHCERCGACLEACPTGARRLIGQEIPVTQLLETIEEDRVFYEDSGGGVTFSGGEPLCQFEFLKESLRACRICRLHTVVDTCGFAREADLLALAPLTGLFLYDLKMMDDAKHRHYTGVSNVRILSNLQALGAAQAQIWIRVPVIPDINDSERELKELARFAASVRSVRQVNLLPYHRTGLPKARRLGRSSPLAEVEPPSAESMSRAADIFSSFGLSAKIGG
jgi:pyruvate formate lyase activating enzyme